MDARHGRSGMDAGDGNEMSGIGENERSVRRGGDGKDQS